MLINKNKGYIMIKVIYDRKGEMIVEVGEGLYYVDECRLWDESIFEGSSKEEIEEFLIEGGWEKIN